MALNANALVTLSDAKIFVGIPVSETSLDTLIESLINAASERIERFCNRKFTAASFTEFRDGGRINEILLFQWPVNSITELNVDPKRVFGASTIIDSSNYQLFHDEKFENVGIRRTDAYFPRGPGTVKVVYNAGYTALTPPADLDLACKIAVAFYFSKNQNKDYATSTKSKGDEDTSILQGLPRDTIEILEDYKRLEIPGSSYPIVNR